MADQSECGSNMFVEIQWNDCEFGVSLEQIYSLNATGDFTEDTVEAIEDWHYWVNRGYCF